jgi:hypothetical protein
VSAPTEPEAYSPAGTTDAELAELRELSRRMTENAKRRPATLDRIAAALERIADRLDDPRPVPPYPPEARKAPADFWPAWREDKMMTELYRDNSRLPETLLELFARLRGIGYYIGKLHDLPNQAADGQVGVEPLDRVFGEGARVGGGDVVEPCPDCGAVHQDSSRCVGGGTPTERSVEVAADSAAGPAGAPLVSGRSWAARCVCGHVLAPFELAPCARCRISAEAARLAEAVA